MSLGTTWELLGCALPVETQCIASLHLFSTCTVEKNGKDSASALRALRNGACARVIKGEKEGRRNKKYGAICVTRLCICEDADASISAALLFPLLSHGNGHHSAADGRRWRNLLRLTANFHKTACFKRSISTRTGRLFSYTLSEIVPHHLPVRVNDGVFRESLVGVEAVAVIHGTVALYLLHRFG